MEAPEKIYLHPTAKGEVGASWLKFRLTEEDIEYIRKDVLMRKLSDAFCDACGHFAHSVPNHICRLDCIYYKEFMKAMKL